MLTLDEREYFLHRRGEVKRELSRMRSDQFCSGDESPLIMEAGLYRELDSIEATPARDVRWARGGAG
jgi:hypothetical protein